MSYFILKILYKLSYIKCILKPKPWNLIKILSPFLPDHFPILDKGSVIALCFHFFLPFK